MGGRVGKTKNCSQTATIRGPLDAKIPAIITISAVSTAIKYIKGYKIMIRDQFPYKHSLKGRFEYSSIYKKG